MGNIAERLKRFGCLLLCLAVLFPLVPVRAAAAQDGETGEKTVRAGWYEDAYNITGANGERSGYGYEYEQAVAAYTGWKYEYVENGWVDLLEMMRSGEIDIMAGISYTDERAESMLFSELPMGEERYYLYANLRDTDISASDLSTLNGKRVCLMPTSVQAAQFYEWEKAHGLHMQYVAVNSFEQGKQMAANHEIDCVVSTETPAWVEFGMSAISMTGGSSIYFAINKNRPDLKEELDNAMRKMENDKPFYADELYRRYLSSVSSPVLATEEEEWLSGHGAIRVGWLDNDAGVSMKAENGELTGVITDYITLAENSLGEHTLSFEPVEYATMQELTQALADGDIDMIFHFSQNPYIAEQNGFVLSNTVWTINMTAVTTQNYFDETAENTVAIAREDELLRWYISYNYPKWKVLDCDSFEDAEKAVRRGEADCVVVRPGQSTRYVEDKALYSVYLTRAGNTSFAVKRGSSTLLSILNKTLQTIPITMLSGALSMYDSTLQKVTLVDFFKDNFIAVTGVLLLVFAVILLIILSLLHKSQAAEVRAREAAVRSDELNRKLQKNHEELEAALLKAENANSAKTIFLNHMSHDIRTPMNAIIGFTNIALRQNVSGQVKNCLDKISDSSELLLTLINDVLDISRIESGRVAINPVIVDITSVVDGALNVTAGLLSRRDLQFVVNREKTVNPYVYADSVRIREILVNILGNAVKFTEDGGTITFTSSESVSEDGKHVTVRFVIADTGIGMSEAFQKQMFDEFSQEHSGARTQYKGTGLGMAITKRYVDMMGGTISVQSEKGKGSTFTIELPLTLVSAETAKRQEAPVDWHDMAGLHVLLAEDNDLNAEIAVVQLEEIGMKVTRAADGKQAVELFEEQPAGTFDVILMDVMMPNMDGYEATAAIRSLADRPDGQKIPIIALTANAFAEDVQASIDADMNGHVSKPLVVDEVVKAIARNIRR